MPRVVWDAEALLGEGPIWDEREGVLHWVDVDSFTLHTLEPSSGAQTSRRLSGRPTSVALRAGGGLLVAHDRRVSTLEGDELVPFVEDLPIEGRTNDGAVDPRGRYLVGSVAADGKPGSGSLFRVDPDASVTRLLDGLDISNGIDWSLDGETMFYVDSEAHGLDAFDYDLEHGTIANRRRVADIEPELGVPDGLTLDADGTVWLAVWGGACIRRYAPSGELLQELPVAARQPTSCIFGGDDFATLYVTSARTGIADPVPQDGSLFAFDAAGVRGRPAFRFAG